MIIIIIIITNINFIWIMQMLSLLILLSLLSLSVILRGYTNMIAQNLGDFWKFFLEKSIPSNGFKL